METLRNNHLSVFFSLSLSAISLVRVCLFVEKGKPATQSVNVRDKRRNNFCGKRQKKATRQKIQVHSFILFFTSGWLLMQ